MPWDGMGGWMDGVCWGYIRGLGLCAWLFNGKGREEKKKYIFL
jgi:hypothetical protein